MLTSTENLCFEVVPISMIILATPKIHVVCFFIFIFFTVVASLTLTPVHRRAFQTRGL